MFSVLAIDSTGSYLRRSGNCFVIEYKGNKKEYSADQVRQILFLAPSAISSEAIKLASEKHVDIVYLDWRGHPYARTYNPVMGGTTLTRRKQLEASFTGKGITIVKAIVKAKIRSQMNFLKTLFKDHPEKRNNSPVISYNISIDNLKGTIPQVRGTLLGIEGAFAAYYFKTLGLFTGISTRNPNSTDPWNVCLNYAYGMLYSEVERSCILAGLDPYLGFYHTDRYGKPSLVLDIAELFRVAVTDRAVLTLFNRGQIKKKDFEVYGDRRLSQQGRQKIISAISERFDTSLKFEGKSFKLRDIILVQTRSLAAYLLGHKSRFNPFIYR